MGFLGRPVAEVLVDRIDMPVAVAGHQATIGVVDEAIVDGDPVIPMGLGVERADVMGLAPGREVLPGGDVPIAVEPRPTLPAGQGFEGPAILDVHEAVVADRRLDEAGFPLAAQPQGGDE